MFVTDPNQVEGGEFQYFLGTRHEAEALHTGRVRADLRRRRRVTG